MRGQCSPFCPRPTCPQDSVCLASASCSLWPWPDGGGLVLDERPGALLPASRRLCASGSRALSCTAGLRGLRGVPANGHSVNVTPAWRHTASQWNGFWKLQQLQALRGEHSEAHRAAGGRPSLSQGPRGWSCGSAAVHRRPHATACVCSRKERLSQARCVPPRHGLVAPARLFSSLDTR